MTHNQTSSVDWNVRSDLKGLTKSAIDLEQKKSSLPFAVCALNVTGDLNIGVMMRTSVLVGAEKFFMFGRRVYDRRSTVGAQNYIDVHREYGLDDDGEYDVEKFHHMMNENGYRPIFVEQGGTDLRKVTRSFLFSDDLKPCFVFGNEGMGIPDDMMNGHDIVSIPQNGVLRSYNVSSAASIVLFRAMEILE